MPWQEDGVAIPPVESAPTGSGWTRGAEDAEDRGDERLRGGRSDPTSTGRRVYAMVAGLKTGHYMRTPRAQPGMAVVRRLV
jgi:hypothetical protein